MEPLAASGLLGIPPTEGVLMHPTTMEIVQFDRVGMTFWKALRHADSVEQATADLAATFDVTPAAISDDVERFIGDLTAQGLVVQCPPPATKPKIRRRATAIVAAHNRRESTVRCLRSLFACVPADCSLTAVLVDDGSTDGTTAAVRELGLPVTVVRGPGDWYWSRSMAEAEAVAESGDPEVILWLNDDVELDPTAMRRAMEAHQQRPEAIIVGALWSPQRADVSFTGMRRTHDEHRVAARQIAPSREPLPIDLFHGNFVLVPRSARRRIGPLDGSWPHHYADLDYAERACKLNVPRYLLPGLVGVCEPEVAAWLNPDVRWPSRVRTLFGRKGWPPRAHSRFLWRHGRNTGRRGALGHYIRTLTGESVRQPPKARLLKVSPAFSHGADHPERSGKPPKSWTPTLSADLIRLGPPSDGGYVVSRTAALAASHLISGGLSDDWAFEAAFRELNPAPTTVYDGTMGWTFWLGRTWNRVGSFLRGPSVERLCNVTRFVGYRRFFNQPGVQHVARNLTATGVGASKLAQAIDLVPGRDVFVKLDIEGGEYPLLGSLVAHRERITGLVMELHLVSEHADQISQFIDGFDSHVLTFVRANNAGGTDANGMPRLLEMTWTRRDLFVGGEPDMGPITYQNVSGLPPCASLRIDGKPKDQTGLAAVVETAVRPILEPLETEFSADTALPMTTGSAGGAYGCLAWPSELIFTPVE